MYCTVGYWSDLLFGLFIAHRACADGCPELSQGSGLLREVVGIAFVEERTFLGEAPQLRNAGPTLDDGGYVVRHLLRHTVLEAERTDEPGRVTPPLPGRRNLDCPISPLQTTSHEISRCKARSQKRACLGEIGYNAVVPE